MFLYQNKNANIGNASKEKYPHGYPIFIFLLIIFWASVVGQWVNYSSRIKAGTFLARKAGGIEANNPIINTVIATTIKSKKRMLMG